MASYNLSPAADADLEELFEYTIINFGEAKADSYLSGLLSKFKMLADNPMIGSDRSHIKENLLVSVYESHSIYYLVQQNNIFILRILGAGQDPTRQLSQRNS